MSFELEQAKLDLETLKTELQNYLFQTYKKQTTEADRIYIYLSDAVDKIIKRQPYTLKWGPGGTPLWHTTILNFIYRWVNLEIKISELLTETLIDAD